MAALLTSAEIVTEALRDIGAFSKYDVAPDAKDFAVGCIRLDLILAEVVGSSRFWWMVPDSVDVPLAANVASADIHALTDPDLQFFYRAYLVDEDGENERQLTLIGRLAYEGIDDKARGGTPDVVFIERNDTPRLFVHPVATEARTIRLVGQKYSADVRLEAGLVKHDFPAAWQLYLINRLAENIGSGAVRRLPPQEIAEKAQKAQISLNLINSNQKRAHTDRLRRTAYRDF